MEESNALLASLREREVRGEELSERDLALLMILEQGGEEIGDAGLSPALRASFARLSLGNRVNDDGDAALDDEPPENEQGNEEKENMDDGNDDEIPISESSYSTPTPESERLRSLESQVQLLTKLLATQNEKPRKRLPRVESIADAPKFSGEGDGVAVALSSWIWAIREWLDDFDLDSEKERVKYAAKSLTGAARDWWQNAKRELDIEKLDELFKQLRLFFQVGDVARDARQSYYRWRQITTGKAYVVAMQRLLLEINRPEHNVPMAIADQVEIFVLGLKKDYYDEVVKSPEYRLPVRNELTLKKIFRLVTALDSSLGRGAQHKPGAPGRTSSATPAAKGGARDESRKPMSGNTLFTTRNLTKMNAITRESGPDRADKFYQLMSSKFERPVSEIKSCMQTGACFAKDCKTSRPHTFGSDDCTSAKKRNSGLNSLRFASAIASVKEASDSSN